MKVNNVKTVKLVIKKSKSEIRRFSISCFRDFEEKVKSFCKVESLDELKLEYLDEENDWVRFSSSEEFEMISTTSIRICASFLKDEQKQVKNDSCSTIENLKLFCEKMKTEEGKKNFEEKVKVFIEEVKDEKKLEEKGLLNIIKDFFSTFKQPKKEVLEDTKQEEEEEEEEKKDDTQVEETKQDEKEFQQVSENVKESTTKELEKPEEVTEEVKLPQANESKEKKIEGKFSKEMKLLSEMGFNNFKLISHLLEHHKGNIQKVVELLTKM